MELALQVVGLKMTGKLEDAKNVAMRIVGNAGEGSQSDSMQVDSAASDPSRAAQALLFSRARDADDFETLLVNFLSIIDAPVQHASDASLISAMSHTSTSAHTLLHLASMRGFSRLVQFLVQHDADLDARDTNGLTALHFAALAGDTKCAKILLRAGADSELVDAKGITAAELAENGFLEDLIEEVRSESERLQIEESDEEAGWGDGEEEDDEVGSSRLTLTKRHISRWECEKQIPDVSPNMPEVKPVPPSDQQKAESADAKFPSYADVIQRTLAQLQRHKDRISNLPQLPLPPLLQIPGMPSVQWSNMQWSQLPPMPMVFPVVTPSANWPAFLNTNTNEKGKSKEIPRTAEETSPTEPQQQRPNVKEWLALWEQWMVQVMTAAAAAAASPANPKAEDVPPPYSPRKPLPIPEASTSQGPTSRVGYRDDPLSEQEVNSYVYKPKGSKPRKMQKKGQRLLSSNE
jgi:uncharacterized protein